MRHWLQYRPLQYIDISMKSTFLYRTLPVLFWFHSIQNSKSNCVYRTFSIFQSTCVSSYNICLPTHFLYYFIHILWYLNKNIVLVVVVTQRIKILPMFIFGNAGSQYADTTTKAKLQVRYIHLIHYLIVVCYRVYEVEVYGYTRLRMCKGGPTNCVVMETATFMAGAVQFHQIRS